MSFADFEALARDTVRLESQSWGYRLFANLDAATPAILVGYFQQFMAVTALIAAVALWLVPGSSLDLDLLAMKGAISVGLVILGVAWLRTSTQSDPLEVHIDLLRKEVRVVSCKGQHAQLRRIFRFSELSDMTIRDGHLVLLCLKGQEMAKVALDPARSARGL